METITTLCLVTGCALFGGFVRALWSDCGPYSAKKTMKLMVIGVFTALLSYGIIIEFDPEAHFLYPISLASGAWSSEVLKILSNFILNQVKKIAGDSKKAGGDDSGN